MPAKKPKEMFVAVLSDLRQGAERSAKIYEELGKAAEDPKIKEALDARELISGEILSRLDECFRIIGEQPRKLSGSLHDVFVEDLRRELSEIQSPVARRIFILANATRLVQLSIGEYLGAIAAADAAGHPAAGVLLESCLADKLAFAERTRRLIGEEPRVKLAAA